MFIVPQGLHFSVFLTFDFHHNKSEQSKLEENSALNLKLSYFPFFDLFDLALYIFLYLT